MLSETKSGSTDGTDKADDRVQSADGRKKLSEIKTGEKFAFGGRFYIGVELATIDEAESVRTHPLDLETGTFGLDGKNGWCDPNTMVYPIDGAWVITDGCRVTFGEKPNGLKPTCVIVDEFVDSMITEKDMDTLRRLFIERYPPEPER